MRLGHRAFMVMSRGRTFERSDRHGVGRLRWSSSGEHCARRDGDLHHSGDHLHTDRHAGLLDCVHSRRPGSPGQLAERRPQWPCPPYCVAYIVMSGDMYAATLDKGKNVVNCFDSINPKSSPVFPLPAGTPAPG